MSDGKTLVDRFQAFLDKISAEDYEATVGDRKTLGELIRETQKVITDDNTTLKTFHRLIDIQQTANTKLMEN